MREGSWHSVRYTLPLNLLSGDSLGPHRFWWPSFELWLITVVDRHSILDEERHLFCIFMVSSPTPCICCAALRDSV